MLLYVDGEAVEGFVEQVREKSALVGEHHRLHDGHRADDGHFVSGGKRFGKAQDAAGAGFLIGAEGYPVGGRRQFAFVPLRVGNVSTHVFCLEYFEGEGKVALVAVAEIRPGAAVAG